LDDGLETLESLADDSENLTTSVVRVLEIIPDVDPEHATQLLAETISQDQKGDVVESVLHILLEDPGYPKVALKQATGKRKREDPEDQAEAGPSKRAKFEYDDKPRRRANYSDLALVSPPAHFFLPTHLCAL
jgi:TRIAD3 protein (E3 ubiquitin-protein ligase RNF216)